MTGLGFGDYPVKEIHDSATDGSGHESPPADRPNAERESHDTPESKAQHEDDGIKRLDGMQALFHIGVVEHQFKAEDDAAPAAYPTPIPRVTETTPEHLGDDGDLHDHRYGHPHVDRFPICLQSFPIHPIFLQS